MTDSKVKQIFLPKEVNRISHKKKLGLSLDIRDSVSSVTTNYRETTNNSATLCNPAVTRTVH